MFIFDVVLPNIKPPYKFVTLTAFEITPLFSLPSFISIFVFIEPSWKVPI